MLSVLRDPGPMTNRTNSGSGFLCLDNDDASAELHATLLAEAGIPASKMTPWNAYPWYINRKPNAADLRAGLKPLRRLLEFPPPLRVVMLHGGDAHALWAKFDAGHALVTSKYYAFRTYHTSRQAFIGTREVREERKAHLQAALADAAKLLEGNYLTERPALEVVVHAAGKSETEVCLLDDATGSRSSSSPVE
jgi:hypothetical protein